MTPLAGVPLVQGTVAGAVVVVRHETVAIRGADDQGPPREQLEAARRAAERELRRRLQLMAEGPAQQILRAHLALMADPMVTAAIAPHLDAGSTAAAALAAARATLVAGFEALSEPLLRARAADVSDVCEYIARHLEGQTNSTTAADGRIVCAASLSPADVLRLAEARPLAFIVESPADTSHSAILMQAVGVPTIVGVAGATAIVRDGDWVLVDADRGQVIVDPDARANRQTEAAAAARRQCDPEPARTRDGVTVAVTATIASASDACQGMAAGADGVGLFRTEWLFMRADRLPSEEEQFEVYREVASTLPGGRPVTVRALDLGGDKLPPPLHLPVTRNPALGLRGVRLALAYPELLETQMRALARAFDSHRLRVLLPMVTDPADVMQLRSILDRTIGGDYEIGAMIETPAAALMADELASVSDFMSLGTNDLTQYALAVDRDSEGAASVYRPVHPALLRLIRLAAAAAARAGRPLSVCGQAAGDPVIAPLLVGLGVTELSVAPNLVVPTKALIREISVETARALAGELAALPTAAGVAARLGTIRGRATAFDVHPARDAR